MALHISHIRLKNWKNFPDSTIELGNRMFIIGQNALGKSNLLDAIVFLKDIAALGFQSAMRNRGGIGMVRTLWSTITSRRISIDITITGVNEEWRYFLEFGLPERGKQIGLNKKELDIPRVKQECIWHNGTVILKRQESKASEEGKVTYLESPFHNEKFLELKNFFSDISLLHLVPQMVKERILTKIDEPQLDQYGRNFIEQISQESPKKRQKKLKQISNILSSAIPHLENLEIEQDKNSGVFHLVGRFKHWRPNAAKHDEQVLSDGTIRLVGILWTLLTKKTGVLLLDEPEISLHSGIVKILPQLFWKIQKKSNVQILITTHSLDILEDKNVAPSEVVLLSPRSKGGTEVSSLSHKFEAKALLEAKFPLPRVVEAVSPISNPEQMCLAL